MKKKFDNISLEYIAELYGNISKVLFKDLYGIASKLSTYKKINDHNLKIVKVNDNYYLNVIEENGSIYNPNPDCVCIIKDNYYRLYTKRKSYVDVMEHNNGLFIKKRLSFNNYVYDDFEEVNEYYKKEDCLSYMLDEFFKLIDKFQSLDLYDNNNNLKYHIMLNADCRNDFYLDICDIQNGKTFKLNNLTCIEFRKKDAKEFDSNFYSIEMKKYREITKYFPQLKIKGKVIPYNEFLLVDFRNLKNDVVLSEEDFFKEETKIIKDEFYNGRDIQLLDFKNINFDGVNISNLDFSNVKNLHIDIDKIVKDLTNTSLKGYNLSNKILRNFNLTNTNLSKTGATIDIGSCMINIESKMNTGTIFDEDNKFILGEKKLNIEQVESLGIKVLRK